MKMNGRAWVFGDNIQIDGQMMPLEMVTSQVDDGAELSKFLMTGLDPEFPDKVEAGDIIIGGKLFGSGSFHVQALTAMKHRQLGVVTESVARGFFRLSVWCGLPVLPSCPNLREHVRSGDRIEVDFFTGVITTPNETLRFDPLPPVVQEIMAAGGEEEYVRERLRNSLKKGA